MENKQNKSSQASLSIFSKVSAWIFSRLGSGVFGGFFTSYDETNDKFKHSLKKKAGNGEKRAKRTLARTFEKNILVNIIPRLQDFLLRVSVRDYGIVLFTMALSTCAMFLAHSYWSFVQSSVLYLVTGIALALISLPMLFSKKPIADLLLNGRFFSTILFSFLGLRDSSYVSASEQKSHTSPSIALLAGLILSVVSFFIGPLWTVAAIALLFLAYQLLLTPESGIIVTLLVIPFTSSLVLAAIGLYVTACYIIKCVVGKRTFKFEYIDLWMLIMMLVVVYGGLVSFDIASSAKDMALMLCFTASFFVISNLMRSKEWYKRCIIAISISSTLSSIIGIAQSVLGRLDITWDGFYAFSEIHDKVNSAFLDPDSFALFLVSCLPFLLLFIFSGKTAALRIIGLVCSVLNVVALVLTYSKVGYIGVISMLILLLLILHRNTIYLVLIGVATAVVLNYALPEQALDALSAIVASPATTHSYRMMLFDSAIQMISARPFGSGIGQGAFEMAHSSIVGTDAISNVGNLYLQIAVSCGILGLILFISGLVVLFRLCFSYCAKTPSSMHRINALAGFCGAFGILFAGFYGYVWADKSILTVFCICIAITFSYIKIERDGYNRQRGGPIDVLSASIEIELDRSNTRDFASKRKYVRSPKGKGANDNGGADALNAIKGNELDGVFRDDN